MSRFYVRPESIKNKKIYVDGPEAHHILNVMRLRQGDEVTAFDGTGRSYCGRIKELSKKSLVIQIESTCKARPQKPYTITLAQAILRKEKMGYIVEKAAELDVDSIIPMHTKRCVAKLAKERYASKLKKWERIAREASKQCGRDTIARIKEYSSFDNILAKKDEYDLILIPSLAPVQKKSLKKVITGFHGRSILLFIGPEGGFDPEEIEAAKGRGVTFISLGENTLKSDTAAISAIAMISCMLNES